MKNKKGVKRVDWLIKVPEALQNQYRLIASVGEVSVDELVTHVLQQWVAKNRALLMMESLAAFLKKLLSKNSDDSAK